MTRRFCLMLLGGAAAAQIAKPRVGYILDRDGGVRAVDGVAGAFTVGPVLRDSVLSVAYSGASLVVKKAHELFIDDKSFAAPDGPATVVFDAKGTVAEIFFAAVEVLWTWNHGEFTAVPAHDVVTDAYVREGDLFVKGVPVRLRAKARQVSQLGEGWLAAYSDDAVYAIRGAQVFELPEADRP